MKRMLLLKYYLYYSFTYYSRENFDGVQGAVGGASFGFGDFINNFHAGDDFSKNDIVMRERVIGVHDKKLRTVGVGTGIGHCHCASSVFSSERFIGKLVSRVACSGSGGIASLNHKPFNHPVKNDVIVETFLGKVKKVLGSFWCIIFEFDDNVSFGCF